MRRETAVPALIANHHGLVEYVNDAFVSVFGWSREEILGSPIATIIPRALRDAHHLGFSRFLVSGTPTLVGRSIDLPAMDCAGNEFLAEHRIEAEQTEGRWVFGATIEPKSGWPARAPVRTV